VALCVWKNGREQQANRQMKISLFAIEGAKLGLHNVKNPRLDQVDQLVEAKKKTYVQVELTPGQEVAAADAIVTTAEGRPDLLLHDLEFVETRLSRDPASGEKALFTKLAAHLEQERPICQCGLSSEEQQAIAPYRLLTAKPMMVVEKAQLDDLDPVLNQLLQVSGYISFLTVGGKENRAWLIKQGSTAWEAAGVIHSDIQKGFIRAEIIGFEDLVQTGGETHAKRAGKMRLETKEYRMRDCDITNFRFNK